LNHDQDTIAAISTPAGTGGIGIVRMSGEDSIDIVSMVFERTSTGGLQGWRIYHGALMDSSERVDEVLVSIFKKPDSYTRENMVEIYCHGGMYVVRRVLEVLLKNGARMAAPGEFTKRAFLNGRIDLSQAEAVSEVIYANTEKSLKVSMQHLQGMLKDLVHKLREELIHICSLLEVELDFAEEDIEFAERIKLEELLNSIKGELESLLSSFKRGKVLREGVKMVIVGRPNVGKSSLLNALLKEDRAIVTDLPGTTRDSLEEQLDIHGIFFRAVDTAGINITEDIIEKEGITRTYQQMKSADIIVHVLDGTVRVTEEEKIFASNLIARQRNGEIKLVAIINKNDLPLTIDVEELEYRDHNIPFVYLSAKNFDGIHELEDVLHNTVFNNNSSNMSHTEAVILTQERHAQVTQEAIKYVDNALQALKQNLSSEFIAFDVRNAMNSLGEIIGVVTTREILNNIFDNFCIGK